MGSQPFPDLIGDNPLMYADKLADRMRPLKGRVIQQQGVNFTRTTTAFDAFGNSTSDAVLGTASRTESAEYQHDLAKWIVMLPKRRLVNGTEVERTEFTASMLPWKTYRYGLLANTFTYDAHGSLSTVKEGSSTQTTTLSGWKFGIPQTVQFAIAGQSITANVDSRGWITSVTDELNFTTSYSYDLLGRVSGITYPPGDSTAWTPTSITFSPSSNDPFGIGAGHWKKTVQRGNYRQETHFDALWRPVIELEQDVGVAASKRYKAWRHDEAGRVTFAAYPRDAASSLASFGNAGVSSTYDALGRPSSVSQTTELGNAVTQYAYLTGFKTRVTNPRTYRTETTFQAFGEPATNAPLSITAAVGSPEQQLTTITRNAFGNTTLLERSGTYAGQAVSSTRTYIYDANQRLCKRIEPESGVTLIDYNAAGNVAWTADGTSWTKIACDRHMVAASEKTLRSYDARNRPTLVNFPDTSADIATTYYPDGAVSSILTTDGSMLTYEYNRRRLLTSERLQHGSINWLVSHGYTALGDRATVTYPDGHIVSFAPNALGQPTQAGTYAAGVTYHPNGAIKGFTYGNGQVHSLSLNARQLPMTSRDAKGAEVAIDDTYDYDFNGNVAGISDALLGSPAGDRDMVYDALDRLAQVTAGPAFGGNGAWAYDPLDNIRLFTRDGITMPAFRIAGGIMLFVIALVLLVRRGWAVAGAVTAFTVAHSLTLAGVTLGLVGLPPRPVEAVIALSIVFLAVELVRGRDRPSLTLRYPWAIAFAFGLFHGFGFAGALAEIGLPDGEVPAALLAFNLGVEAGQLFVVAVVIAVLALASRIAARMVEPAVRVAAYAIGITASYWLIDRIVV